MSGWSGLSLAMKVFYCHALQESWAAKPTVVMQIHLLCNFMCLSNPDLFLLRVKNKFLNQFSPKIMWLCYTSPHQTKKNY